MVDLLHWNFINDILKEHDLIYLGDIKSHDIVKGAKNKSLNLEFNDLKFYQLKQRLLYKAAVQGKVVIYVPEHHTTKTCSNCGTINNNVGSKEIFQCCNCKLVTGRDINAAKNIKMKGIMS
jgi:putative transposase